MFGNMVVSLNMCKIDTIREVQTQTNNFKDFLFITIFTFLHYAVSWLAATCTYQKKAYEMRMFLKLYEQIVWLSHLKSLTLKRSLNLNLTYCLKFDFSFRCSMLCIFEIHSTIMKIISELRKYRSH